MPLLVTGRPLPGACLASSRRQGWCGGHVVLSQGASPRQGRAAQLRRIGRLPSETPCILG